ncbi:hypothetical protein MNV49_005219 [Pseudohyphozyma bogoriensis]|nr:hypothetical protein MNV49_005219 [Pseudohyphozyma bogoriensis]
METKSNDIEHLEAKTPGAQMEETAPAVIRPAPEASTLRRLFMPVDNTLFFQEALDTYPTLEDIPADIEKRLLRKIDWIILPALGLCYAFYYIDYAALYDLKKAKPVGLGLSSIFYFGWLAWAIPSAQAASKNFAELAVLRVLSGAFEAIADPAFMLITTMFYTRAEQPGKIGIWYSANGIGIAGGGLLGYCIGLIKGSLATWKYEFLIIGALCSAWGIALAFIIPNSPATAIWLTREERLVAVARLRGNQTGTENKVFSWYQAKEAVLDIKLYLFFFLGLFANIPNGGISNFSTLIIQGLGYGTLNTALLGIPQGVSVVLWIALGTWLNNRLPKNSRTTVSILFMIPAVAGLLGFLLAPVHASVGRLICYYLTGSKQATIVLCLSLITSNTAGQTKKVLFSATIWFGAAVGNISQAPTYRLGIGAILVSCALEIVVIFVLRMVLQLENRRRDKARDILIAEGRLGDEDKTAYADLTDKQNPHFRYVW